MSNDKIFSFKISHEDSWQRFELYGPVTEEARPLLAQMVSEAGPQSILDLKNVGYINSVGIRDWSYMLKDMKEGRTVVFEHVPDDVIRTMNMVLGFRQGLPIRSVIRTYVCDECNKETLVTLKEGQDYSGPDLPPAREVACAHCGAHAEPIDPDEDFFMFITDVA